jgi:hypothetical protein
MTSFDARLRVVGQTGFPLGVEVDLTTERMVVVSGEARIADWALDDIKISRLPDGFHIIAEGEEIILNVTDKARFADEVGRRKPEL